MIGQGHQSIFRRCYDTYDGIDAMIFKAEMYYIKATLFKLAGKAFIT